MTREQATEKKGIAHSEEGSERQAEEDEESRCSLYPPATSLILTMKDRNTEE